MSAFTNEFETALAAQLFEGSGAAATFGAGCKVKALSTTPTEAQDGTTNVIATMVATGLDAAEWTTSAGATENASLIRLTNTSGGQVDVEGLVVTDSLDVSIVYINLSTITVQDGDSIEIAGGDLDISFD